MTTGAIFLPARLRRTWHGVMARAGEEVLFRALLAERDLDRGAAHFWLGVYSELAREREAVA